MIGANQYLKAINYLYFSYRRMGIEPPKAWKAAVQKHKILLRRRYLRSVQ